MIALVDYDNIHEIHRRRGLEYIGQRIAESVGAAALAPDPRIELRLYGGWFEGVTPTRRASILAAEIATAPFVAEIPHGADNMRVVVTAQLALGPVDEPRVYYTHTFRLRGNVTGVTCRTVPPAGCSDAKNCPFGVVDAALRASVCTTASCSVIPSTVLARAEQKMVDTHIVADLLAIARRRESSAIVVTTDDDMWPGVRTALGWGLSIYHIHPVPGRATPTPLLVALPSGYHQSTLA